MYDSELKIPADKKQLVKNPIRSFCKCSGVDSRGLRWSQTTHRT